MAGDLNAVHSKGFFFHGSLPNFLNEEQLPQTKRPFTKIQQLRWAHTMHLVFPKELADSVQERLQDLSGNFKYAKVMMSLSDILTGEFFNDYIKQGDVSMLSEGRSGIDNIFSFHEGILRLEVDRPAYERTGLVGAVIPDGGSKHKKSRFLIELNLRSPSMFRGKSGFNRLLWAAKNVLNNTLTWLFFDHVAPDSQSDNKPIRQYHPLWNAIEPLLTKVTSTLSPNLVHLMNGESDEDTFQDSEYMLELEEWLSLITLGSSRAIGDDSIDPYICRYQLPGTVKDDVSSKTNTDLVILRWHGFIPSSFMSKILSIMLKACKAQWSSICFENFKGDSCTVLQLQAGKGSQEYLEWDHRLSK